MPVMLPKVSSKMGVWENYDSGAETPAAGWAGKTLTEAWERAANFAQAA